MTTRKVASVGNFIGGHFPERQLYHRSRGAVQFMVLSAPMQMFLLALTLAFLGWVAYASVNVVFKDQIIAAKEQHFATMQAAYEGRLAEMQAAYDELNGALVLTQERFASATKDLEDKHKELATILARQEAAARNIKSLKSRVASAIKASPEQRGGTKFVMGIGDSEAGQTGLAARQSRAKEESADTAGVLADSVLDSVGDEAIPEEALAAAGAEGGPELPLTINRADLMPALKVGAEKPKVSSANWKANVAAAMPTPFAEETRRIDVQLTTLDKAQQEMIVNLDQTAEQQITELEGLVEKTGLNVDRLLQRVTEGEDKTGEGGPFVPLSAVATPKKGEDVKAIDAFVQRLSGHVDRLTGLESALMSMPLVNPLKVEHHVASGFGKRYDPFTKRPAFHYGLDLVAPFKSEVHVTAPGRVVHAGRLGPYGNMVEIDHGNGMHTRYGHLYAIKVKVGQSVGFQDVIGLLGSTGRSTGPHLHYEVRFNGTLRDPARFLEAGRYVFQG